MSSDHTVTGAPTGRPAHAARPGISAARAGAILVALCALGLAGWLVGGALLRSAGPTTTAPESASLITVSLTPAREHPGLP